MIFLNACKKFLKQQIIFYVQLTDFVVFFYSENDELGRGLNRSPLESACINHSCGFSWYPFDLASRCISIAWRNKSLSKRLLIKQHSSDVYDKLITHFNDLVLLVNNVLNPP